MTDTSLLIAMPAVVYTMFGGVQAVTWTDVKIMVLIVFGLLAVIVVLVLGAARGRRRSARRCGIAAPTGRLHSFDFSFDLTNQYTFWSGTIAALFLFCSYFGTDQSQVQRYLTARSVDEARDSLLMSAYWKIPLQVARAAGRRARVRVLRLHSSADAVQRGEHDRGCARGRGAGVCGTAARVRRGVRRRRAAGAPPSWRRAGDAGGDAAAARGRAARRSRRAKPTCESVRGEALALVREATGDATFTDVNYIIPDVHPDAAADRA